MGNGSQDQIRGGALAILAIVGACGAPPRPSPREAPAATSAPPGPPVASPLASPLAGPLDAGPVDSSDAASQASSAPEREDAGESDAAAEPKELETFEQPGIGACTVDEDCTWTHERDDCCYEECEPRAMSLAVKKRRLRGCEVAKPRRCPLPRACAPRSCVGVRARCAEGKCTLVCRRRQLPPPPAATSSSGRR